MAGTDPIDLLLVEDNPGDVNLIERIFEDRSIPGRLHTVRRGDEALDWIHRRGEFEDAPRPNLLLLDLNLPAVSGYTVLEEIKSHDHWCRLPVIVLTGSPAEEDVIRLYDGGANAYLLKPANPRDFGDMIERCMSFWIGTAELPSVEPDADE